MIIKNDPDIIVSYLEDSSNMKGGYAREVVFPENAGELSDLLKRANSEKVPVTISGGGTGTTGSRIPFGGIVVSTEKLNRISDVSGEDMTAGVQAGALVEDLKKACENKGLFYTSHPTEGTATVGGTVATNASGSRSFKYGPTRRYVKRLKMVLAGGEIADIRRGERFLRRGDSKMILAGGREIEVPLPLYRMPVVKNAAGYFAEDGMDLIDLFIGQEGTLSVVTDVELGLVKKPSNIFSCFVFFKKEEDAWGFAAEARGLDALSIEYFDSNAIQFLRDRGLKVPAGANGAIFFEQEMIKEAADILAEKWIQVASSHNASSDDTWVAMNEERANEFTGLRHAIPEAVNDIIRRNGFQKLSTDIAVPDDAFSEMMNFYAALLRGSGLRHAIFGHIGECHVHVNIMPASNSESDKAKKMAIAFVKKGVSIGGTVSAEHGIGKIKHNYLEMMYGKNGVEEMVRIKKAFDPNCILGLDNIFPKELLRSV